MSNRERDPSRPERATSRGVSQQIPDAIDGLPNSVVAGMFSPAGGRDEARRLAITAEARRSGVVGGDGGPTIQRALTERAVGRATHGDGSIVQRDGDDSDAVGANGRAYSAAEYDLILEALRLEGFDDSVRPTPALLDAGWDLYRAWNALGSEDVQFYLALDFKVRNARLGRDDHGNWQIIWPGQAPTSGAWWEEMFKLVGPDILMGVVNAPAWMSLLGPLQGIYNAYDDSRMQAINDVLNLDLRTDAAQAIRREWREQLTQALVAPLSDGQRRSLAQGMSEYQLISAQIAERQRRVRHRLEQAGALSSTSELPQIRSDP